MAIDLSRVVSAGVGPIIVISACGLLSSTFYTRMTNVITRLRAFQRERLAEQTLLDRETDPIARAKRLDLLANLHSQTESLIKRVVMIRRTIFCVISTIMSLIVCSLSLGLSTFLPAMMYVAVTFFTFGLSLLFVGLCFALVDLKMSLDPVVLETTFVTTRLRSMDRAE